MNEYKKNSTSSCSAFLKTVNAIPIKEKIAIIIRNWEILCIIKGLGLNEKSSGQNDQSSVNPSAGLLLAFVFRFTGCTEGYFSKELETKT